MGRRKRDRRDYTLKSRKFDCPITTAKIAQIDHKDVELLQLFVTEKGKILPARSNYISAKNQRMLTRSIKRARDLALLSYTQGYVPTESENTTPLLVKTDVVKTTDSETSDQSINESGLAAEDENTSSAAETITNNAGKNQAGTSEKNL